MIVLGQGKVIGVLTPVLDGFYYGEMIKSISEEAQKHHAKVIVIGTSASYYRTKYAYDYVDGWIVIMDAVDNDYIQSLRKSGKPVIGINTLLDCDYQISLNNDEMMIEILGHLMEHGHQRIAYVGDNYFYDAKQRYHGYLKAINHHKLNVHPEDGFYNTLKLSSLEIVQNMIDNHLPFSAVVCVNDFIAHQLYHHFKEHQINVPKDIAIIGFDNNPMAKSSKPSLSSIHIPFNDIGKKAVNFLVNLLESNSKLPSLEVQAYPIYRESCGCHLRPTDSKADDPLDTFEYLSNMVARNFNLGQLMQTYNYKDFIEMNWLHHTPFRSIILGLWEKGNENKLTVNQYRIISEHDKPENIEINSCLPTKFPAKSILFDNEFMQHENTIIVIPIMQGENEIGVFGLVGLADITTQLSPLNTTYQIANFFASAHHRLSMNEEIKSYSKKMELISNIMYDGIWDLDLSTKEFVSQGGIHKILGYEIENLQLHFTDIDQYIHPDDIQLVKKSFRKHIIRKEPLEIECRFLHVDGHYVWMYITGQAQYNSVGKLIRILGSIMDITERKKAEKRINELAYHDTLTGLANRASFEERLVEILEQANKAKSKVAILLFDLDRFKIINDSYGHQAGDRLLQSVAKRVRSIAKEDYLIARLGGDEFIIALPNITHINEAADFGNQIIESLNHPFIDENKEHFISCSMGLSVYPTHGLDAETITLFADIAMYKAKAQGRNRLQIYSKEINDYKFGRLHMENQLREAIDKDELLLHYQPLYCAQTKEIKAVEALLRWNSSEFGMVQPLEFIPLAEETGLIIPIGEWVLTQACILSKKWESKGYSCIKVSVNISSRQLNYFNFVKSLKNILKKTECHPNNICLEITESTMLEDIEVTTTILQQLIELGVNISIDDFGTGYSSLGLLKNLPIQMIKIDKSFIDDVTLDVKNSSIVQAIINMSHSMSLKVVAEGVERNDQMKMLQQLETDYVQGFHMSKPMAHEEVEKLLEQ